MVRFLFLRGGAALGRFLLFAVLGGARRERRRRGQPPGAALGGSRSSPWERGHAARCRAALAPRGGLLVQRAYLTRVLLCEEQGRRGAARLPGSEAMVPWSA